MAISKKCFAFVDGSFNKFTNTYGGAAILFDQFGRRHELTKNGNNNFIAKMRNVAGEIIGAKLAIEKALQLGMKTLIIFYDYDGVGNWPTGIWRCKKEFTKDYANFVKWAIKKGLAIHFQKVKGHSGIQLNEEVDRLAKIASGVLKEVI